MTKPKITIHNVETGEMIEREMTASEITQLAADKAANDAMIAAEAESETKKAALLTKLGITAEEAKLLLS